MAETALMEVKEIDKVGRPCKYESHVEPYLDDILQWLKNGMNEYSICDKLGISKQSWIKYKDNYIELANLHTRATHERNCLVMNAQFEKAKGIKEIVPKAFKIKEIQYDGKGKKVSEIERLEYGEEHMYIPPDVNAADLFLRNNDPEYKSAKSDQSGNNIVVNFQLSEARAKVEQLLSDRQKARAIDITGLEVIEAE